MVCKSLWPLIPKDGSPIVLGGWEVFGGEFWPHYACIQPAINFDYAWIAMTDKMRPVTLSQRPEQNKPSTLQIYCICRVSVIIACRYLKYSPPFEIMSSF